jgi:hypothetical protein
MCKILRLSRVISIQVKTLGLSFFLVTFLSLLTTSTKSQTATSVNLINEISSANNTESKPQSKIWKHDGYWWAVFPNTSGTYVWKLDNRLVWSQKLKISNEIRTEADCKKIDANTYVFLFNNTKSELINLTYNEITKDYQLLDENVTTTSFVLGSLVETAVIEVDDSQVMWIAYEENQNIKVNSSSYPYTLWGTPTIIESGVKADDICSIISLPGKVGVFWSNQYTRTFGFKTHSNGNSQDIWSEDEKPCAQCPTNIGDGASDDHINMATTSNGDLFSVVKTGYDNNNLNLPLIGLLKRNANGVWDELYYVDSLGTRPMIIIDESQDLIRVIYSQWYMRGAIYRSGNILYRESSLSSVSFGKVDTLIHKDDYSVANRYENPSASKDNFEGSTPIIASSYKSPYKVIGVFMDNDCLQGKYDFTGNNIDSSGFNNHCVVNGAELANDRFDNENSAYLFDGVNDKIELTSDFDYPETTINLWFKVNEFKDVPSSIYYSNHPNLKNGSVKVEVKKETENVGTLEIIIGENELTKHTSIIDSDKWYMLTVLKDAEDIKYYLNCKLISEKSNADYVVSNTGLNHVVLGNNYDNTAPFNGVIDDVEISRCLIDYSLNNCAEDSVNAVIEYSINNDTKLFPNPFSEQANVTFSNQQSDKFQLTIINLQGKQIRTYTTLEEQIRLDRNNLPSGIYFYELKNLSLNKLRAQGKMVVID